MTFITSTLVFIASLISISNARADDDPYFQFGEPEIIHFENRLDLLAFAAESPMASSVMAFNEPSVSVRPEGEDPFVIMDGILQMGARLWTIVEANEAVLNVDTTPIAGLPPTIRPEEASNMSWDPSHEEVYGYRIRNLFRMTVVQFAYAVSYQAHGHHPTVPGEYLQVRVRPLIAAVSWGYKMDVTVESKVSNIGTFAEPRVEVALSLNQTIKSPLRTLRYWDSYLVQSDGQFRVTRSE